MPTRDVKLIAFDVDGTLADYNSWPTLHKFFNFSLEEDLRLYALWKKDEWLYKDWMDIIEVEYQKTPRTKDEIHTLFDSIELNPGVAEVVPELAKNYRLAIISSGVHDYVQGIAERLNVADTYAYCRLLYNQRGEFEKFEYHTELTEKEAKVHTAKELQKKYGLKPHEIAFVGDSFNDAEIFKYTGRGVQYTDREPRLRPLSWKQITHMNELLDIF